MKLSLKFLISLTAAAGIACARMPARAGAPAEITATFSYGGDAAEIPAQFTDGLVFLSTRVDQSSPSLFQLNTTETTSSLAPTRAAEIGRTEARSPVLGFEGLDVSLPALPLRADETFGSRVGQPYQATLGNDFLSSVIIEVDYARQTVRAFSPTTYKYSGKGSTLPLKLSQGLPLIPAQAALARGKVVQGDFLVNTALDTSVLISNKFLASHKNLGERGHIVPAIDPISGEAGASLGKLRGFKIGQLGPDDVLAAFTDSPLPDVGAPLIGEIGAGMLRRFVVVFDFPHHQMILTPNSHFPDPDQEDKSGLLIVGKGPDYKRFEVIEVQPHTPAAEAGIEKGDIIAGVDAEAAADLSLLVTRDLFQQVGHKYKLVIEHNGESKEVTLQMRRYF
jgi:PDZ domain-containing protein